MLYLYELRVMTKICTNREPGPDLFHELIKNVVSGLVRTLEVVGILFSTSSEKLGRN